MTHRGGRHFLQVPGPTNIPDRILRAMNKPPIDHRGPEFFTFARELIEAVRRIFRTKDKLAIFPCSGTGAWEAAIANTLSPGDRVLMFETGQFGALWRDMALRFGLDVDFVPGDWRHAIDVATAEAKLAEDRGHHIKAVMAVHNETSTGVVSRIADIRRAMDRVGHPALLMVDAVSSLGAMDYRHDEWAVDVSVVGSQKALMLPPGMGLNAISAKAIAASRDAKFPRSFWDWGPYIAANDTGSFPYTPPVTLMYGLRETIAVLEDEGLENVFARHLRLAEATRRAVRGWGLEVLALDDREASPVVTAVLAPAGIDGDAIRKVILDAFDMSLGAGLGKVKGKVFRIGHIGYINELSLAGALCGVEMGLGMAGVPCQRGGVLAALDFLAGGEAAAGKRAKKAASD